MRIPLSSQSFSLSMKALFVAAHRPSFVSLSQPSDYLKTPITTPTEENEKTIMKQKSLLIFGYLLCIISVNIFSLPTSIGIVLLASVSGAQLSSYATFLSDPYVAPLSIVMTSLSTISSVFITPLLLLLLIGKRLPIDVKGMVFSITQIVLVPITFGLLLNRFFPHICNAIPPFLPLLSVLVAALSAGAPLALNIDSVKSSFGFAIFLLAVAFHLSSFVAGYILSGFVFRYSPDVKPLQRTISFETGMQSSLLTLALANNS
uniref:Probable sodium/metabolite cotransporter BASS5, chloroplastic n=1 Tax=Cicer arietinum TaxID=3827 RepID=A0A3Q7YEK2_CICAR|nr:probable sodium/metabolite cotransporter BASS5, chloroplastic [Cicer arietinum]